MTTFANVATTFANGLDCHGGSQVDFDLAKELGEQRRSVPRHHIEKWDLAAIEAEANETPRASWAEDEIVRIEQRSASGTQVKTHAARWLNNIYESIEIFTYPMISSVECCASIRVVRG